MASLIELFEKVATGNWQREYFYKLTCSPPAGALPLPADIDIFFDNFRAPGSKHGVIKKNIAGQWANYAGVLDNPGVTDGLIRLDEGGVILSFFERWHALSGSDISAAAFPKSEIVGTVTATLYKTDKTTPVMAVVLSNAWIPEIGDLSLDKTKDGFLTTKITIAYDKRASVYY